MEKTLKEYLENATHYLFPAPGKGKAAHQRECFFNYCAANGLDEEFKQLVKQNSDWVELAEKNPVFFFEDAFKGNHPSIKTPTISLLGTEGGLVPVIKVLLRNRNELIHFYD